MAKASVLFTGKRRKIFLRAMYISAEFVGGILLIATLLIGLKSMVVKAAPIKVGLITGLDTLTGKSISWMGYQGLLHAEQDLGVIGTVYTSTDPSDFEPNVMQCAVDGNDLCLGIGFSLREAISQTAAVSPTVKFAVIDSSYDNYLPNVRGTLFRAEEVGYLAGTLAGKMSQSEIVGDLGGMEITPVTDFTEGYKYGAQCANPEITVIISYTNNFDNPQMGAEYAQGMIAQGADVIFAAAGPTGNGAVLTTTQSGVWAIGVDSDQYISLFDSGTVTGSNYLLTSAMKRYDNGVFITISDVVSGTFSPGSIVYDLADQGVGLAPFHETEEAIPLSVKTWLDWIERAIIAGRIEPLNPESPCLAMYQNYLPITRR